MRKYFCDEYTMNEVDTSQYILHSHNDYEIYMFLEGDSKYIIEDKVYTLKKNDIIIVRKNEMHRVFHNSSAKYTRIVLMISPQFFSACPEYEYAFLDSMKSAGNKIDSRTAHASGLYDAFMRFKKYTDSFTNLYTPVAESMVMEILYLINQIVSFTSPETNDSQIMNVISYVNSNYTKKISLDFLEKEFYISKYHMCRQFRKITGHTILSYIRNKRLIYANELIEKGYNKSEAALLAGFGDYTSYYRAYKSYKEI